MTVVALCPTSKTRFLTKAQAARAAKKQKFLHVYLCPLGDRNHWHTTKQKQGVRKVNEPMTNAERKHFLNRLADLGRQIANDADRHNKAVAKRQAAEIQEHNRRMALAAAEAREQQERLADLAETVRIATALNRRQG